MPFTEEQQFFINKLRSQLSMRYAAAAGSSYILPSKLGDEELWEDLLSGVSTFNMWPPNFTAVTLRDVYQASAQLEAQGGDPLVPTMESGRSFLLSSIMMCAMFHVGIRLQWFEAGKHFIYNDNGISIQRTKQQDYAGIVGGSILQFMNTQLNNIKIVFGLSSVSPKGQFSGLISMPRSLTRGARGTRLGSG